MSALISLCVNRSRRVISHSLFSSTVSLIAFVSMALLAVLEFFVYQDTWMKYEYEVDKDFSRYVFFLCVQRRYKDIRLNSPDILLFY